MAIPQANYYYNAQLRNYVLQFMAIFSGLQVRVGASDEQEPRLITVPIHYGQPDRVVAAIKGDNTQNKPLRLPIMSAYMRNFNKAEDMYAGTGFERRNTYVPVGGLIPDDIKVVHQRRALPYKIDMELSMYASNTDQHFQMLEQILPLFDPQLNIQTSDGPFDMARLTHVKLLSINLDNNYPIGMDRRINQSTLMFEVPIYLDTPADVRRDFVEKIFMRIGAVSNASLTNYDMVAELDQQGIEYDLIFGADDLPFE